MLKVCWDCLIGNRIDDNDGAYDSRVNRDTTNAWNTSQFERENMYRLPKPLKVNDSIIINITIPSHFSGRLQANLTTGFNTPDGNVTFEANLGNPDEQIVIDGKPDPNFTVLDLFAGKNDVEDFNVTLTFKVVSHNMTDIDIGATAVGTYQFKHYLSEITHFTLNEEVKVKELHFQFA